MKLVRICLAVMMAGCVGFIGCAVEPGSEGEVDAEAVDFEAPGFETATVYAAGTIDPVSGGKYTAFTSEEYPPVYCPSGQAAIGAHCDGSFCDNYQLICKPLAASSSATGDAYWTEWFEVNTAAQFCGDKYYVVGVECQGGNCDNIRLRCKNFGRRGQDCKTFDEQSSWHSEETYSTPFRTDGGRFITGAKCNGRHCDNKKYWQCEPG